MNCAYIVPEDQKENDTFALLNSVPNPIIFNYQWDRKQCNPYRSLIVSSRSVAERGEAISSAAFIF